ncbi:MAG: DUF481 domain-containing protein [Planctomycetes bacterium]|nr:DUF481 domain-containing protein [Planctomycetota bacterium]
MNTDKSPNSKHQVPNNIKTPMNQHPKRFGNWKLGFGIWCLVLCLCVFVVIETVVWAEEKPKPPPPPLIKWSGTIESSFSSSIGRIDTSNTTFKSDTYGETKNLKLYSGLLYLRGKSENKLTSFQRRAEIKGDRKLASNFYGYLQQVFNDNQVSKLKMGSRSSGGFGYHFIKTNDLKESVDIGASYNSEEYENLTLRKRTYSYQFINSFYWKITKGLELYHKYEYLPNTKDFKEFRSRSDGSVKLYLGKHLYSSFGIINEYERKPASPTTPKHKGTILITIGFRF